MAADDFIRGSVEMLTLLILHEGDHNGYQIMRLIIDRSDGKLFFNISTMYPALYRLCDKGYISSHEEMVTTKNGKTKKRVTYHLEPLGLERLRELMEKHNKIKTGIESVFDKSKGLP